MSLRCLHEQSMDVDECLSFFGYIKGPILLMRTRKSIQHKLVYLLKDEINICRLVIRQSTKAEFQSVPYIQTFELLLDDCGDFVSRQSIYWRPFGMCKYDNYIQCDMFVICSIKF